MPGLTREGAGSLLHYSHVHYCGCIGSPYLSIAAQQNEACTHDDCTPPAPPKILTSTITFILLFGFLLEAKSMYKKNKRTQIEKINIAFFLSKSRLFFFNENYQTQSIQRIFYYISNNLFQNDHMMLKQKCSHKRLRYVHAYTPTCSSMKHCVALVSPKRELCRVIHARIGVHLLLLLVPCGGGLEYDLERLRICAEQRTGQGDGDCIFAADGLICLRETSNQTDRQNEDNGAELSVEAAVGIWIESRGSNL